jgi:hypothetical protein
MNNSGLQVDDLGTLSDRRNFADLYFYFVIFVSTNL